MKRSLLAVLFPAFLLTSIGLHAGILDTALEGFKQLASDGQTLQEKFHETGEKLKNTDFSQFLSQGLQNLNEMIENSSPARPRKLEQDRIALRHFLKALGERKFGDDGLTLNEKVQQVITSIRPDLRDTDFAADPAGGIYYFLALDPGGFAKNVKIIRGPMGMPMTLSEAYQYYYQTDPEKAARILILLETLQKIGAPTTDENQLEIILKAVKTNIDLINDQSGTK